MPIILLYQQNTLIALQGEITKLQTDFMRIQTVAESDSTSHALYQETSKVVNTLAKVDAAKDLYKSEADASVMVTGRGVVGAPKIGLQVTAVDYSLDLCGPRSTVEQLRPRPQWTQEECQDANPYELLSSIGTYEFEKAPNGPTILSWIYYVQDISKKHHDLFNGASTSVDTPIETYTPNVLRDAQEVCLIEPATEASSAINLATALRRIESSSEAILNFFKSPAVQAQQGGTDSEQTLRNDVNVLRTSMQYLSELQKISPKQQDTLLNLQMVFSKSMDSLVKELDEFSTKCQEILDRDKEQLQELKQSPDQWRKNQ
jgi:hypothetical protein